MKYKGDWYGDECFWGIHHDLHVLMHETNIGEKADAEELAAALAKAKVDLIQVDSKGHEGINSYKSKVPSAQYPPALKKELLVEWRKAADILDVPLHCHHSGVQDRDAVKRFPEWAVVAYIDGKFQNDEVATCCQSQYAEQKLIPQMIEMIKDYGADGVWLDGEIWGVRYCYCERCKSAFREKTGIENPPVDEHDENFYQWTIFNKENFENYVSNYLEKVAEYSPKAKICSNWLYSFRHPGEPKVKTHWLSGDNSPVFGLFDTRLEARFLSTRGRPWELVLWNFYPSIGDQPSQGGTHDIASGPWVTKPVEMLTQEAAYVIAFGGNVMVYEQPKTLRDGRMVPWHMKRLAEVAEFLKPRRTLCQNTETLPNIAILHSEEHYYRSPRDKSNHNLFWGYHDESVRGTVFALTDSAFAVDVLDEWALFENMEKFPCIVVPEQDKLSERMVKALKRYVENGGKLLVTGEKTYERFGSDFLGVCGDELNFAPDNGTLTVIAGDVYHVPAADGRIAITNTTWRCIKPTSAKELGRLSTSLLLDDYMTDFSSATVNKVGKGLVAYIPTSIFNFYFFNRYPLVKEFIKETVDALSVDFTVSAKAPACIDVIARQKEGKKIIHLINLLNGFNPSPRNGDVGEIPKSGEVVLELPFAEEPANVYLAFEDEAIESQYSDNKLTVTVPTVHIHSAVVIEH